MKVVSGILFTGASAVWAIAALISKDNFAASFLCYLLSLFGLVAGLTLIIQGRREQQRRLIKVRFDE